MKETRYAVSLEEICRSGFSTPFDAPMIPPFPFEFRNMEVMTVCYQSNLDSIYKILPPPLEPINDKVLIHIYAMHDTSWIGPYQECNVMVSARLPKSGQEGAYSPYLFLSSEIGLSHGREVHGQPKKLGYPKLEARGDLFFASVHRNGIQIITSTLAYKQKRGNLNHLKKEMDFSVNMNLKVIDHVDGRPAIRQITSRKLTEVNVYECWSGPSTIELRPNIQAPVYRLPVKEMELGYYWKADFTLVEGEILHDYLEPTYSSGQEAIT